MDSKEARAYIEEKVREIAEATGCTYVNITLQKPSFGAFVRDDGSACRNFASAWTMDGGNSVQNCSMCLFDK